MSSDPVIALIGGRRLLAVLALLLAIGCAQKVDDGLTKFPVTGTVLVDGKPQAGVRVRFFRYGKPGRTNADTPAAVTDREGRFVLSTNGDGDGAVAGTYKVTFFWKRGNAPGTPDLLGGRYTKLETSPFEVTVVEGENELPPFELEAPNPSELRPRVTDPSLPPAVRGKRR